MRTLPKNRTWVLPIACLLLAGPSWLQAAEQSEAETILDKAIAAKGGATQLGKYRAHVVKGKGVLHRGGQKVRMTYECYVQDFEQARSQITFEADAVKIRSLAVINQDRGWTKKNDEPAKAMSKDQLEIEKDVLYLTKVTSLLPLKDKAFELASLGTLKRNGQEVVALKVSFPGEHDVKLYFDAQTWLLLKAEQELLSVEDGIESTLEMFPDKYQKVGNVQAPMRMALRYGEMPYAEYHHTELRMVERLDDRLFSMP
jgi:hypothetical protein